MKRYLLLLLTIGVFAACKTKKSGHGGDEPMTLEEFQDQFPVAQLPYKLSPDSLKLSLADSLALDTADIHRFLTDTLTKGDFAKTEKVKFWPLQRMTGNPVDYMVVKASGRSGTVAYLCFMDKKKGHFLKRIRVADAGRNGVFASVQIDNRNVVKLTEEVQNGNNRETQREDFYGVSADGSATLIMTNTSSPSAPGQIFNPLDTLPRKHKFSGDYTSGDLSLVSIRDGEDGKSFQFFITFSKDNGKCKGEVSGKGQYLAGNRGEYKDKETSCGIAFQFSAGRVAIREIGGCGAYRGIKCFFEGNFAKKAEKKKKK
ncbi:hypothetical protein CLV59_103236 [Chitinophaga dinghuensis]|uniref:Lipoprotein n=1 Tax=Chitinophaga dinghuensis TaxID=1539050 RepID=A0A327W529_9BACT|nr:hypothetical protein [Chitinophaga dinghuensis]RAJ83275.1 hypothetical protein CLV59_103236 [Chitinophaga dinghuensis]